ncbi:S-layer homology domain-containing protein [Paenibacillus sp. F411]|nr:S-layer homology domain-containing protein [Paenibacillus sp. F411]MBO2946186.1 S-layer homology domain-containing protein [Paenibacillus sp. F411]
MLSVCLLLGPLSGWTGEETVYGNPGSSPVDPKLAAGFYHAVSLVSSGDVYTWGQNTNGQLGNGTTVPRSIPVKTTNIGDVIEIATGARSSMALKRDGTVWSWGANEQGELGIGSEENVSVPVQVQGLPTIQAIAGGVGYHKLALDEEGEVWGWGRNEGGQVGDGTFIKRTSPVKVQGLKDVIQIAAGEYNSLALKSDGTVWAWGHNDYGEIGDGTKTSRSIPVQVSGLSDVLAVSAGTFFSIALKKDGTVWAWGRNLYATLGDGSRSDRSLPVQVQNLQNITKISAGAHHSLALDAAGYVWGWGDNNSGQLGQGHVLLTNVPLQAASMDRVIDIAAGGYFSLALKDSGIVWAWGYGRNGEMGDNTSNSRTLPAVTRAVLDTTAPVPDTGLIHALETEAGTVVLDWNAASDNLISSDRLEYLPYVSTSAVIDTVARIEQYGTPLGFYTPALLQQTVSNLEPGKTYYFNVIVRDKAGYKAAYTVKPLAMAKPKRFTVTYDGNGSTAGSEPTDPAIYAEDDVVKVPGNIGGLSRDGYEFIGWSTAADGSGNAYAPGDFLRIADHHVTLYAHWRIASVDLPDPGPALDVYLQQVGLKSDAGPVLLSPGFTRTVYNYEAAIKHDSGNISVTADVYGSKARVTVSVYGQAGDLISGPQVLSSGLESPALPLPSGNSRIELEVSAAAGVQQIYTVTLVRDHKSGEEDPEDDEGGSPGQGEGPPAEPPVAPITGGSGQSGSGEPTAPVHGHSSSSAERLEITALVNNRALSGVVKATVKQEKDDLIADVILKGGLLSSSLAQSKNEVEVFITVPADVKQIKLDVDRVAMELLRSRQGVIKLQTSVGLLTFPVRGIPEPAVSQAQGGAAVSVQLSMAEREAQESISRAAFAQGYRLLGVPVELKISVPSGDSLKSVASFSRMVELRIPRSEAEEERGSEVTTAAVWQAGNPLRHVPASMKLQDGKALPEVVLSTLAPGTFVLLQEISSPVFEDLRGHWSEPAVKSLASKMIVQGHGGPNSVSYAPNAPITRAELLAIMVRALGLQADTYRDKGPKASPFTDVKVSDWFYDTVGAAYEYGIVQGYGDGALRPSSPVTRQEAMVLMMRLSETAGGRLTLTLDESVLSGYTDKSTLSSWAEQAAALFIQHGVIQGSSQELRPTGVLTRAEAAVMTERLLVKTGLIKSGSF